MSNGQVVTRYAPSPTGFLHVGGARTALFNHLFAKQHEGRSILRIEDTDRARSKREYEEDIFASLEWLGLRYDDSYRQSERRDIHREALQKLLKNGAAYTSKESQSGEGMRSEVIRFRNPKEVVVFDDRIRGEIRMDTADLGDFVIAKDEDTPLYHLAVVCDDIESGITHVIRGEDHISNTARQILIQRALGQIQPPAYAHLPLLLSPDRSKLSKRHGAVSVSEFRRRGILPEALLNFLALCGWHPSDDREIFTFDELVRVFDLSRVQRGGAIFDEKKLAHFNRAHMKRLSSREQKERIEHSMNSGIKEHTARDAHIEIKETFVPVILERATTFDDIRKAAAEGEYDYLAGPPKIEKALLKDPKTEPSFEDIERHLAYAEDALAAVPEEAFSPEALKDALWDYASKEGKGAVLWPIRVALSGKARSPDPFAIAGQIGKGETIRRLSHARELLRTP